MLPSKYNKFLGEFSDLLVSGEKAVFKTLSIYRILELDKIKITTPEVNQVKYNKVDILLLMLIYPLFCLSNVYQYSGSRYKGLLEASKNTFYRFKNSSEISWRTILYEVVLELLAMLADIFEVEMEEVMSRIIEMPEKENRLLKIIQKSALTAA